MLIGPPGAGKTTYVQAHRAPGDCQVDIDLIPKDWPQDERRRTRKALLLRAAAAPGPGTCWFSTAAPTRQQRAYWRSFVPIAQTIVLLPPLEQAVERQQARDGAGHPLISGVYAWYDKYEVPFHEPNTCVITPA